MTKQELISYIQFNGYNIDDIALEDGKTIIGRKCSDGTMIWGGSHLEGKRFDYLFKRYIENVMKNERTN